MARSMVNAGTTRVDVSPDGEGFRRIPPPDWGMSLTMCSGISLCRIPFLAECNCFVILSTLVVHLFADLGDHPGRAVQVAAVVAASAWRPPLGRSQWWTTTKCQRLVWVTSDPICTIP